MLKTLTQENIFSHIERFKVIQIDLLYFISCSSAISHPLSVQGEIKTKTQLTSFPFPARTLQWLPIAVKTNSKSIILFYKVLI